MQNKNYIVDRDSVHAGRIVKTDSLNRVPEGDDLTSRISGELDTYSYDIFRTSTLFVPNENNLFDDLLYNSPNYPILNLTDDAICQKRINESPIINHACNLGLLLEHLGYKKELRYEDIVKIRKTFFRRDFLWNNCELFGLKRITPEELKELNPHLSMKTCKSHSNGMYTSKDNGLVPETYFWRLDEFQERTFKEALEGKLAKDYNEIYTRFNSFRPDKREENVRKLSRF